MKHILMDSLSDILISSNDEQRIGYLQLKADVAFNASIRPVLGVMQHVFLKIRLA